MNLQEFTLERARLNANLGKQILNENGVIVTDKLRDELQTMLYDELYLFFKEVGNTYGSTPQRLVQQDPSAVKNIKKLSDAIDEREKEVVYNVMHEWENLNFGVKK